jgi:shikimate kinase
MKTNIALIGFMGTGKTVVGKLLAKKLGKQFVEMDRLIERRVGKPIPEIFQEDGEIAFRELEIDVTRDISKNRNSVIACGGGIVLNKINIDRLRESSIIIYLTASPEIILERTTTTTNRRPLLDVPDPDLRIRELLEFRKPFYERAADITIDTSGLGIHAVADQIIDRVKKDESFNF